MLYLFIQVKLNGQVCKVGTMVPAEYEHFQKVNCPIPSNRRKRSLDSDLVLGDVYHASVSNNGLNFSTEVTMIIFDSLCTECNSTSMTCTLKVNMYKNNIEWNLSHFLAMIFIGA